MEVKVEVSARHIHLSEEDFVALFGQNVSLISIKKLSQEDDFAAEETVKFIGPKGSFNSVRVIGPFREDSQVEVSYSDARVLGIEPPLKVSGQKPGTTIKVIGPKGEIEKEIAIIAKRHLHLSPEEASSLGLNIDDIVSIKFSGERAAILDQIVVRVKPKYSTSIHIDTDEGNSVGIKSEETAELIIE